MHKFKRQILNLVLLKDSTVALHQANFRDAERLALTPERFAAITSA
jgi:hypothetical protein